jgi:hypothetical protein
MDFSSSEMIKAIEERLPFGKRLVQVALFMGFSAFVAECALVISRFAKGFWQTIIKRPADWHIVTLGEILSIIVFLVGMWIFTKYWLGMFDKYSLRVQDIIKKSHDQLVANQCETEKFAAIAEKVYRLLEEEFKRQPARQDAPHND